MTISELLVRLLNAKIDIGPGLYWREIVGNVFGLASALLGMRRRVSAWPVGIVGNVILFTVFLGSSLGPAFDGDRLNLWGQAGRQVFFLIVSAYGWVRWHQFRKAADAGSAGVAPRWAGRHGRLQLLVAAVVLWVVFYFVLGALHSYGPAGDAWILTGSILATYAMARGWVEFWLIWVAVDAVGVPLLFRAGYYPSAVMYIIYGVFCLIGLVSWARLERSGRAVEPIAASNPVIESVG